MLETLRIGITSPSLMVDLSSIQEWVTPTLLYCQKIGRMTKCLTGHMRLRSKNSSLVDKADSDGSKQLKILPFCLGIEQFTLRAKGTQPTFNTNIKDGRVPQ